MRLLPGMAMSGAPRPFDRDARRRGLALRVGVALPAAVTEDEPVRRHLEAHGVSDLWRVDGRVATAPASPVASWLAGDAAVAEEAGAIGAGWLAVAEDPPGVLRGIVAAEEAAAERGSAFPEAGVGVLLASGLQRGDLAAGQVGATGPASLRTLMERYIAVGVTHFALMPVTDDLDGWVHRICGQVTNLDDRTVAPCGC